MMVISCRTDSCNTSSPGLLRVRTYEYLWIRVLTSVLVLKVLGDHALPGLLDSISYNVIIVADCESNLGERVSVNNGGTVGSRPASQFFHLQRN